MKRQIYLDNAATTALHPAVFAKMTPYFMEDFGNPSSVYGVAQRSKKAVDEAREQIAKTLGARTNEIYFTGGGSEADNWAIKGTAEAMRHKGNHIITTKIEHHAVLHTCEHLERHGYEVTYLDVDADGLVQAEDVARAIRPTTILISIMFANNEIGTIQPIGEIGALAKRHGVLFHTDAVQAFAHVPIDVDALGIDMLSASGHKFYGPKGIGFLYLRESAKIGAFIHGGSQERARRAGTLNVPGIVGMGEAARIASEQLQTRIEAETALRDHLIGRVQAEIPHVRLNGHRTERLPNNVNFNFRFIEGEALLILLDQKGVCGSSGSACSSGSLDPSHVLLAIGLTPVEARGSLRLTLSADTTRAEIDEVVDILKTAVERLRAISPYYEEFLRENKA